MLFKFIGRGIPLVLSDYWHCFNNQFILMMIDVWEWWFLRIDVYISTRCCALWAWEVNRSEVWLIRWHSELWLGQFQDDRQGVCEWALARWRRAGGGVWATIVVDLEANELFNNCGNCWVRQDVIDKRGSWSQPRIVDQHPYGVTSCAPLTASLRQFMKSAKTFKYA